MLQNAVPAIVLLIVMAGIAGLLQRYRRHLSGAALRRGPALQLLGGVALGPQQRLVTVQVGQGEQAVCLVLGVAPGGISALHQLPMPVASAEAPAVAAPPGPVAGFAERLARFRPQDRHAR